MRGLTGLMLGIAVLPALSRANVLLYEPFDYPTGTSLVNQSDTYVSPNQPWNLTGVTDGTNGPSIVQGDATDNLNSLSVPGLMPSIGNAMTPRYNDSKDTAAPRIAFANNTIIAKNTTDPSQTAGTTVFYSLMLRVDPSSTDVGNTGSSSTGKGTTATNQGIYIAGFNNNTVSQSTPLSAVASALTMHQDPVGSDDFSLGLTDNVNDTTDANAQLRGFDDADPLTKGSTIFVVASYTYGSGDATTDRANLWINPDIGTFGQATPVTLPNFTDTTTVTGLSAKGAAYQLASFFLRDNSNDPSLMTIDEVRVGTTWADVTPRNPSLITGDANLDGVLDYQDFNALQTGLNNHLAGWANGDFNGDGVINADDVSLFEYNFALYGTNTTAAPEPGALSILALLGIPITTLRKRSRLPGI